jgi:HNH endonuclease
MTISHSELKRLLHYDPETGIWTWLASTTVKANRVIGCRAGTISKQKWGPRIYIIINGKRYRGSLLVWFYMTGEWPPRIVDHKNRNTIDDSWNNLRLATGTQNNANCKIRRHNRVGLKGVQKHKLRWRALIGSGKNRVVIGSYDCPAAAHFAYSVEADKRYGEFARAR